MPPDDPPPPAPPRIPRPPSQADLDQVSEAQGLIADEWAEAPPPEAPAPADAGDGG